VPAYNEASRLSASLRSVLDTLEPAHAAEIIVVDDGSTDGTYAVAAECLRGLPPERARIIRYSPNRGKGYAVRVGLLAARAPIALFTDADLSTPLTELPKLVDPIERGECDVAFGSRALDRTLIEHRQPGLRETGGRVFNWLLRAATGLPFLDTQCGFKVFRMSRVRPILEAAIIERFGFDVELLYLAYRVGLRLREVPVRWHHCDGSKVSLFRDGLQMLQEVGRVRWQALTGTYGTIVSDATNEPGVNVPHRVTPTAVDVNPPAWRR
jgi:glycosyltransferase involved in cell wall biosynthesis